MWRRLAALALIASALVIGTGGTTRAAPMPTRTVYASNCDRNGDQMDYLNCVWDNASASPNHTARNVAIGVAVASVVLGLIPASIAAVKGRSFIAWWAYGALLFIVAFIHALTINPTVEAEAEQERSAGRHKCPWCAEFIRPEAAVCRYCGRDLPDEWRHPRATPSTSANDSGW